MDGEESMDPSRSSSSGFAFVTLIIKPFRLEPVLTALKPFHLVSLTASETRGYGRQKGHLELYRGSEYEISFIPKVKIEAVVADSIAEKVIATVMEKAKTGKIGDGKIFVTKIEEVIRIRTGEKGESAI